MYIIDFAFSNEQISIVSQEPVLFNCSIEENIAYGFDGKVNSIDLENAAVRFNIFSYTVAPPLLKTSSSDYLSGENAENGQCS